MKKTNQGTISAMKNLFPVQKTLAFRLVPVGKTLQNIEDNGIIGQAEQLEKDYTVLKAAADRVHKRFIEETLSKFHLDYLAIDEPGSISEYAEAFYEKAGEKELKRRGGLLKDKIGKAFLKAVYDKDTTMLRALSGKLLIEEILPKENLSAEELDSLSRMKDYTTYMRPYSTIRSRMYDSKQAGLTIPNRIIDDNLPIHLKNVKLFERLPGEERQKLAPLFRELAGRMTWAFEPSDVFTVSAFSCLCPQSAIDLYNTLIGGIALKGGSRLQGVNEIINLYNQAHAKEEGFHKLQKLEKLKKLILSDHESLSWLPEKFEDDSELKEALVKLEEEFRKNVPLKDFLRATENADPNQVLVDAKKLSDFSFACTGRWDAFEEFIKLKLREENPMKKREKENRYNERINKLFEKYQNPTVGELRGLAEKYGGEGMEQNVDLRVYVNKGIIAPLTKSGSDFKAMMDFIGSMGPDEKLGQTRKDEKENARTYIKAWLDGLKKAKHSVELLSCGTGAEDLDFGFYETIFNPMMAFAEHLGKVYNMTRNYLTKKPYSTDKLQLYFGSPTLLGGWDRNKEDSNRGILLQSGKDKFLAILDEKAKTLFKDPRAYDGNSDLKRMVNKYIPNPYRMLPKVGFPPSDQTRYNPSEEVLTLYNSDKKTADYSRHEVSIMVDFYKHVLATYSEWADLPFELKPSGEYITLNEFFLDVDRQAYYIGWKGVSRPFVERAVEKGDLYLFKITCQDMSEAHHGIDGNYKAILDEAFSERNARETAIRINGGAAIYFRKASITPAVVTHPKNIPIANKNPRTKNPTRTLPYDLIKDRRFTENRFALHLPVTLGPDAQKDGAKNVNEKVKEIIRANHGMYVLGINRGERNLLSIAVTAPDGTVVEWDHLNIFDNFDYRDKLARVEGERDQARKDWNVINGIKNIKKGYLSRAIGEIVRLVKKYNCVIALENLDMEFKRGRQQFEKNVYQQFERDLVGRFVMLMDKKDEDRTRTALQLASPGETMEKRTSFTQNGIIFFMSPSWITKTDPLTGFVNRLNTYYENNEKAQKQLDGYESFRYVPKEKMFALSFRYAKANPAKEAGPDKLWTVYTHGNRSKLSEDKKTYVTVNATEEMAKAFNGEGIDYADGRELLPLMKERSARFYKEFFAALRLTLDNRIWMKETCHLVSCTKASDGSFFDELTDTKTACLKDADTNAAWNIARKCHMVLRNIRNFVPDETLGPDGKKLKDPRMVVSDTEWFNKVQGD